MFGTRDPLSLKLIFHALRFVRAQVLLCVSHFLEIPKCLSPTPEPKQVRLNCTCTHMQVCGLLFEQMCGLASNCQSDKLAIGDLRHHFRTPTRQQRPHVWKKSNHGQLTELAKTLNRKPGMCDLEVSEEDQLQDLVQMQPSSHSGPT